jgi:hypothetical protein
MAGPDQKAIQKIVDSNVPERLSPDTGPPILDDHVAHMIRLMRWGQIGLAADHLLFPEINGTLPGTVGGLIRDLNILFAHSAPSGSDTKASLREKITLRQYAYELLLEMALNFFGLESRWLSGAEKEQSLRYILSALEEWEDTERGEGEISVSSTVIGKWLAGMKRVQKGNSMAAKTAVRIEEGLDRKNPSPSFLMRARAEIKGNIYYRMVLEGKCRFGNDYALGLRWLRHLGFEQVSTNPVLAARAYGDEPALMDAFRREVRHHPRFKEWAAAPSNYGEEIALFATLLALWDNLYVFRPIFFNLRAASGGGVVSFQLNPNIAHLLEESVRDVFLAFSLASEKIALYDRYLLAGYRAEEERGRPNMVIKVAAVGPSARTITRVINRFGFGSNITVDFSVSQEATLILEEMEGMAGAVRKGIRPTQLYMTNMGGRFESHLREVKLEELFELLRTEMGEENATDRILRLSEANGTKEKVSKAKTYEKKVLAATRYAHGQRKMDEPVFEALKDVASKESLASWEEAIQKSGTLVARRVWSIFFSEGNRKRWIDYLMKRHGLTEDQASLILDRIHYLPASKRKPFDTLLTLSSRNLVHTEFPDHQENVRSMAETPSFGLAEYEESISHVFSPEIIEQLNQIADFRKGFEINRELEAILNAAGVESGFGLGGLNPDEWSEFGPVLKTAVEFKAAYDGFRNEIVSVLKGIVPPPKKS